MTTRTSSRRSCGARSHAGSCMRTHSRSPSRTSPQAPMHVLVIPKGRYVSLVDFTAKASEAEIAGFWRAVAAVARQLGLEQPGYRVIGNAGPDSGQEVPHFHVLIMGGRPLGRLVERAG